MTCYRPLQAYRALRTGSIVFSNPRGKDFFIPLKLPCGKCVGCSLAYSKQWAVRCVHESELWEYNSFVTLTYNDFYNDRNFGALNYVDVTKFLKRLRVAVDRNVGQHAFLSDTSSNVRFFMCGEYGDKSLRPHFHILFFNLDFDDLKLYKRVRGFNLYTSETLSSFWSDPKTKDSYGHVIIGSVDLKSCAYVSRYCTKKILNGDRLIHLNPSTGEFMPLEKTNMSRRPGIASEWFKLYGKSIYHNVGQDSNDMVVMKNGLRFKPPRYYDQQLDKVDPELFEVVKLSRLDYAASPQVVWNNSTERLIVRESLQLDSFRLLHRSL